MNLNRDAEQAGKPKQDCQFQFAHLYSLFFSGLGLLAFFSLCGVGGVFSIRLSTASSSF